MAKWALFLSFVNSQLTQNIRKNTYVYWRNTELQVLNRHFQHCQSRGSSSTVKNSRRCNCRLLALQHATVSCERMTTSCDDLQSQCRTLRHAFLENEQQWENNVNFSRLSEKEKLIHELHKLACQEFKFTYNDPDTGYMVFTRYRHFVRGKCCGTGCRHCPYQHEAITDDRKVKRTFNSSFYISEANDDVQAQNDK